MRGKSVIAVIIGFFVALLLGGCGSSEAPRVPKVADTTSSPTSAPLSAAPASPPARAQTKTAAEPTPVPAPRGEAAKPALPKTDECEPIVGNWDTKHDQDGDGFTNSSPLYRLETHSYPCYDEVRFAANGIDAFRTTTDYVGQFTADGSGAPVNLEGEADMQLVLTTPNQGSQADQSGHSPGTEFAPHGHRWSVNGACVREVYADGFYEGYTTYGIGVSHTVPYALHVTRDKGYTYVSIKFACSR